MPEFLRDVPKVGLLLGSIVITLLLSVVDWLTGPEYAFTIFYLSPVAIASWYVNWRAGVAITLLSTVLWGAADILSGATFSNPFVPYWNSGVRLAFLLITLYFIEAYRRKLRECESLTITDQLTGVANRQHFKMILEREFAAAQRQRRPLTMVHLDVDNFKQVNDTLGHAEGDAVLQLAAQTMRQHLRPTDIVARLGGDEFGLCLPETGQEAAATTVARLLELLRETMLQTGYPVTFSVGMVSYETVPHSIEMMINEADKLLYSAKASGKNAICHQVVRA